MVIFYLYMQHYQQNKCYIIRYLLALFKAIDSILAVENVLAYNNICPIYYCSQISLQSGAVNYSISDTYVSMIYFFLAMVHEHIFIIL